MELCKIMEGNGQRGVPGKKKRGSRKQFESITGLTALKIKKDTKGMTVKEA